MKILKSIFYILMITITMLFVWVAGVSLAEKPSSQEAQVVSQGTGTPIITGLNHNFTVKTTVTVVESDCIKCLKYFDIDVCKSFGACLKVKIK